MASSKAKDVSKLVEVGITQRRFYLQTLRYLFLWLLIIYVASVGFFSWREWQKPANDSYLHIITGLLNYVSQNEKYSWGDLMLGRKQPADIEECFKYIKIYSKTWLIIASRKTFWWEVGWLAVFSISLVVRGRRRAQKIHRGMKREDVLTLRRKKGRIIIPCRRRHFWSLLPSYFKIPYEYENLGLLVIGASGFGKTVFLNYLLKSILQNKPYNDHKQKIIIHDAKGDFTSYFYGRDDTVLFSFTDPRGVSWNLLDDLFSFQFKPSLEVGGIASCLIPPGDDIWRVGARQIISGMLLHILLTKQGKVSNADIRDFLNLTSKQTHDVLMQLPETQRYALPLQKAGADSNVSFSFAVSTQPRIMEIFEPLDDEANFSLKRDFLDNPKKQILIIQSHPKVRERLKNLLSLAFQVLIQEILSMDNVDLYPGTLLSKKQHWFILDEFFSLGRIPSLRDALTAGRSKGMSLVIATQEFGGIQENYPERGFLDQLKGNTAAKVCFRLGSDVDLKVASDLFSDSEITGLQESHSLGVMDYRDGVQESEKIEKRQVVLPGEIQRLRKNEFFASVPGQPVSRYQTKYFEPTKIAPAREEYPPGHWKKTGKPCKVLEKKPKRETESPEREISWKEGM